MNKKTIDKIKEQIIHDKSILESILIMQRIEDLSKIQDKDHKDHIHNLIQDIAKGRKMDEIFLNGLYAYHNICKQLFQ